MLDLDSLAEKRARSLNQTEDQWRTVIWSPSFQKISAQMSDGEVEALIDLCPSVTHLQNVVKFLEESFSKSGVAPFTVLTDEAKKAGVSPKDWMARFKGES
jgi:hypothetical protein